MHMDGMFRHFLSLARSGYPPCRCMYVPALGLLGGQGGANGELARSLMEWDGMGKKERKSAGRTNERTNQPTKTKPAKQVDVACAFYFIL